MHMSFFYAGLQRLKEKLITCSICLGIYNTPKILHCNHVYCMKCLVGLVQQDQQGQSYLTCPTCRQVMPVPASGVAGIQSDFRTNQLLEFLGQSGMEEDLEAVTSANLGGSDSAISKHDSPDVNENIKFQCPDHREEMKLFCETCQKTACWKCIIKGGKHFSHDSIEITEAFSRFEDKVSSSLDMVREVLARLDSQRDKIFRDREASETEIHNVTDDDVVKTELIGQLHQQVQIQLKELGTERDLIETTQIQLSRHLDTLREAKIQGAVFLLNSTIIMQVNELVCALQQESRSCRPLHTPDLEEQESGIPSHIRCV